MLRKIAFVVLTVVALLAITPLFAMWLTSHHGFSMPGYGLSKKLEPLIAQYHARTGRWPHTWTDIQNVLHADPRYTYPSHCDNHPWETSQEGTLVGYTFEIDRSESVGGVVCFKLNGPGLPVYVPGKP